MANLVVTSPHPIFLTAFAAELEATAVEGPAGLSRLRVGSKVDRGEVDALVRRLYPMVVEVVGDPTIDGLILDTGSVASVVSTVRVFVPPAWRTEPLLAALPIVTERVHVDHFTGSSRLSAASHMLLGILGLPGWGCSVDGHGLRLRATAAACTAVLPPMALRFFGADITSGPHRAIERSVAKGGWEVNCSAIPAPCPDLVVLVPSSLHESAGRRLLRSLADSIPGVSPAALRVHPRPWVEVRLPALAPAVKPTPALPTVTIRTDNAATGEAFAQAVRELGVALVRVRVGLAFPSGFSVRFDHRNHPPGLIRDLEQLVGRSIDECGAKERHEVNLYRNEQREIEIDLPVRAGGDGSLLRHLLSGAGSYRVRVGNMVRPADLVDLITKRLEAEGARPQVDSGDVHGVDPRINVGSAPMEIARHIARVVAEATGVVPTPVRGFSPTDDDIWVSVPPDTRMRGEAAPSRAPRPALRQEGRPFVAISESSARIGETALVRGTGHPLAPASELFEHTCIDAPTAALLGFLAASVRLREPTLLEGPTAAGKTSAILYLASILRHPVIRLNLGGQTDTGELIGRYAPRAGGWSWQEGLIPRAMREGWWVILDEINLAEPSIVERLNPVLERSPSLVVSEGDGARLGPGGAPVAAGFHIFATMNPSGGEYGGRSPLSPALRDRFAAQRLCTTPGEGDVRDLLFRMVLGEQPAITLSSVGWEGTRGLPATHAGLAGVAEISTLLTALSRFHASVDAATRCEAVDQRLGADRREGVVVSRRTLLSVLDYLAARVPEVGIRRAMSQAIDRYYLDRLSAADDRHAVIRLADAAGLVALAELPAALAAREAS